MILLQNTGQKLLSLIFIRDYEVKNLFSGVEIGTYDLPTYVTLPWLWPCLPP